MSTTETPAVGYTRLSQDSDTSIPRQKRKIRSYCDERGIDLVEILDDGRFSSGFDADRTEYQEVRDRIRAREVSAVVVHDKTRIGRDFDERMQFVLDLRKFGVELHSARKGAVDLSNPTDAAVESLYAAQDDEAKREEIEKAVEAVEERLANGYDHGPPRFGCEYRDDGKFQVPGENYAVAMRVIEMKDNGKTYEQIEAETGVPTSTANRIVEAREWYADRPKREADGE